MPHSLELSLVDAKDLPQSANVKARQDAEEQRMYKSANVTRYMFTRLKTYDSYNSRVMIDGYQQSALTAEKRRIVQQRSL
jgi:transposase